MSSYAWYVLLYMMLQIPGYGLSIDPMVEWLLHITRSTGSHSTSYLESTRGPTIPLVHDITSLHHYTTHTSTANTLLEGVWYSTCALHGVALPRIHGMCVLEWLLQMAQYLISAFPGGVVDHQLTLHKLNWLLGLVTTSLRGWHATSIACTLHSIQ